MKLTNAIAAAALLTLAVGATAAEQTYNIGGGKKSQQIATVESATDFETFIGRTDSLKGSLKFDPVTHKASGNISLEVKSIKTGIELRDEHMRSPMWLDAEKHKTIDFKTTKIKHVKGNSYKVTGKFTLHGVTKSITVDATIKHLAESAKTKGAGFKGDVLQVKSTFKIKMSDYGVKIPDMAAAKVSDTVKIAITAYGQSGK
jgi:polyisoprenoid-binding protein YceI